MSTDPGRTPQPPAPPFFERKASVDRLQLIGVPLLALIPIAALCGAFGLRSDAAEASGNGVSLQVSHPALLRYKTSLPFELRVRNTGAQPLAQVTARIDADWLSGFSHAELTPQAQQSTGRYVEIGLSDLPPGAERRVTGTLEASDYGRHRGQIAVAVGGSVAVQLDVRTTVLP